MRREPLPATLNRGYRDQDDVLAALGPESPGVPRRRSAVEIAWDTLLWQRARDERLLATSWDWSRSESTDGGFAALGEFGDTGPRASSPTRAPSASARSASAPSADGGLPPRPTLC